MSNGVDYRRIAIELRDQLVASERLSAELLEALVYARRFLSKEDHDTDYVDSILAKARGEA